MNLRRMDRPVLETHGRDAFALPPPALAISSAQPPQMSDRPPSGNGLDVPHRAEHLEVHRPKLSRPAQRTDGTILFAERRSERRAKRARSTAKLGGPTCMFEHNPN